jgi:hypothetical protein
MVRGFSRTYISSSSRSGVDRSLPSLPVTLRVAWVFARPFHCAFTWIVAPSTG